MTINKSVHAETTVRPAAKWLIDRFATNALASGVALSMTLASAVAQPGTGQRTYDQVATDIRITPDHACTIPQTAIEEWLPTVVNTSGLMDDISRTVFREEPGVTPKETGMEAMTRRIQEDTERRYADAKAIYRARETGGETPIGSQPAAPKPNYRTALYDIKAVSRIPSGVNCSATAWVGALRFTVAYNVTADSSQADGWVSTPRTPTFTVETALASNPEILVHYGDSDLTLAQARLQSARDQARDQAADDARRREAAAQTAYRNSTAGRLAALRQRQALATKQRACEANGGTWGVKAGNTIYEVNALASEDWQMVSEACYFLGNR